MGINPRTVEAMKFKEKNVPKFSAGEILKELVNDSSN
jgi:nucleoid DNA-binding protein